MFKHLGEELFPGIDHSLQLLSLVWPCMYISTTNHSNGNIYPSLTSLGMHKNSSEALVTSEKNFQVLHAVFFRLPAKAKWCHIQGNHGSLGVFDTMLKSL